jgi:outer membrane protein OmpA-like peptidoglycan-associated protein
MLSRILLITISFLITVSIVSAQTTQKLLLYSDAVYFASGSDKVTGKYKKALDEVAIVIKSDNEARAWIQAHTDSLGSYTSNQKLSDRRAKNVYLHLSNKGVDSSQLKIDSHGEYIPYSSNGTASGRAKNRRVTIEVVKPYVPKIKIKTEKICTLQGKVIDANTQEPILTKLIVNSLAGKDSLETDAEGNYQYLVRMETNVEIRAYSKGYFFISKMGKAVHNETVEVNFSLEPAEIGGKMALKDLYFEGGTPLLLDVSQKALEGVLAFVKFNADMKFEIGGHINKPNQAPVSESSSSFILSQSRAKVIYYYLVNAGVDKERLTFKGYGNSEMIHPRASTPQEEQVNRRVELKVIK